MGSMPISQVTDEETGSLQVVALKHSPGFKIAQALFKKIAKTHHSR